MVRAASGDGGPVDSAKAFDSEWPCWRTTRSLPRGPRRSARMLGPTRVLTSATQHGAVLRTPFGPLGRRGATPECSPMTFRMTSSLTGEVRPGSVRQRRCLGGSSGLRRPAMSRPCRRTFAMARDALRTNSTRGQDSRALLSPRKGWRNSVDEHRNALESPDHMRGVAHRFAVKEEAESLDLPLQQVTEGRVRRRCPLRGIGRSRRSLSNGNPTPLPTVVRLSLPPRTIKADA